MKKMLKIAAICGLACWSSSALAALVSRQVDDDALATAFADDGTLSTGEYSATYSNGGGSGFGGPLGTGSISMDTDGANLYVAFDPGADLNDLAVLYLDTRAGGVLDAQMNDRADGGRNGSSNLTSEVDDVFPITPDFAVVFGNFGTVVFELTPHMGDELTPTNGHLAFQIFEGDQSSSSAAVVREIELPLALLGNPGRVDFFVAYTSESGFNSSESLPFSTALNAGGNPGFNPGAPVVYDNYNRFVVPEPASFVLALVGLAAVGVVRRCR